MYKETTNDALKPRYNQVNSTENVRLILYLIAASLNLHLISPYHWILWLRNVI